MFLPALPLLAAWSCSRDVSLIEISEGSFFFGALGARRNPTRLLGEGGWGETGEVAGGMAREMRSRESINVGGLDSRRESRMHHEPAGGSLGLRDRGSGAMKNTRPHIRPYRMKRAVRSYIYPEALDDHILQAMNSRTISLATVIRLLKWGITKSTANPPTSPGRSSTAMSSGDIVTPSKI